MGRIILPLKSLAAIYSPNTFCEFETYRKNWWGGYVSMGHVATIDVKGNVAWYENSFYSCDPFPLNQVYVDVTHWYDQMVKWHRKRVLKRWGIEWHAQPSVKLSLPQEAMRTPFSYGCGASPSTRKIEQTQCVCVEPS